MGLEICKMKFFFRLTHAWSLEKNINLLATVAEEKNIKIVVADFKKIDANASQKDYRKMCCFAIERKRYRQLTNWLVE